MKRRILPALIISAIVVLSAGAFLWMKDSKPVVVQADLEVAEILSRENAGFTKAISPREFEFPRDHGPHPDYGVEWWYFTGNLDSENGQHFGFELTLFRIGLTPDQGTRSSDWAASQLYMGHFALTNVSREQFYAFERFSRDALDLAGAEVSEDGSFHVWLEDWQIIGHGGRAPTIILEAAEQDVAIALTLASEKPLVLQGEQGLSRKSGEPGNASYYYSITRLATSGTIGVGQDTYQVSGTSWMDREWSTSALSEDQSGWDWFALQLSDGRDLMFYQLLRKDGGIDPLSSGVVVDEAGRAQFLDRASVSIEALDTWTSPLGVSYPVKWRMQVPAQSLDIRITPFIKDQELRISIPYWEGAAKIEGTSQGKPISGVGYVEMTRQRIY